MLLSGRVAIIAGAGALGGGVARAFGREGAAVVLGDPSDAALADARAAVADRGGLVRTHRTEGGAADGERLVEVALGAFDRLDVLVCHPAAAAHAGTGEAPDDWARALDATLFGALELTHAAIPPMRASGRGAIVFVNSPLLRAPAAGQGPAVAASGALLTAAQVLARELGPSNIRVNTVVPHPAAGDDALGPGSAGPASDPAADAIVFLASDLAAAVTGQSLDVRTTASG